MLHLKKKRRKSLPFPFNPKRMPRSGVRYPARSIRSWQMPNIPLLICTGCLPLRMPMQSPPCLSLRRMVKLPGSISARIFTTEFRAQPSWRICPGKGITSTSGCDARRCEYNSKATITVEPGPVYSIGRSRAHSPTHNCIRQAGFIRLSMFLPCSIKSDRYGCVVIREGRGNCQPVAGLERNCLMLCRVICL